MIIIRNNDSNNDDKNANKNSTNDDKYCRHLFIQELFKIYVRFSHLKITINCGKINIIISL